MSQENVEIARLAHDRVNAGDLDGFIEFCAPELEFRDLPVLPDAGVHVGHAASSAGGPELDARRAAENPDISLTVSHVLKGGTSHRFDRIYHSPDLVALDAGYGTMDEANKAGSDDALLWVDLEGAEAA